MCFPKILYVIVLSIYPGPAKPFAEFSFREQQSGTEATRSSAGASYHIGKLLQKTWEMNVLQKWERKDNQTETSEYCSIK